MFAKISGAVELTYGEVLYDYFVFVTFVPSPMILTSGALKLVSTQMNWNWGWKQRAVLGIGGGSESGSDKLNEHHPPAHPPPTTTNQQQRTPSTHHIPNF